MTGVLASANNAGGRALLLAVVVAIILLAAALRFHRLGAQSLWYDEGVAYAHSLRALPELLPLLQRNVHVPAYFALLGWWQDLTGSSEFSLRMLSALFSIASVALAYALGKRLFPPIAALMAAAFVALNGFSVYYAQEARMYAMLTAVAAASMWLFAGLHRRFKPSAGGRIGWPQVAGLGLINALGMYTHVAFALVIMAQLTLAGVRFGASLAGGVVTRGSWPRIWLKLALAYGLTLLCFLPWLPVALAQLSAQPNLSRPLPLADMLRRLVGHFAVGSAYEASIGDSRLLFGFVLLFALMPLTSRQTRRNALLPAVWALVSAAIYLHLGLTDRYLRFLLPAQFAMSLWLGGGLWALWALPMRRGGRILRAMPRLAALLAFAGCLLTQALSLDALYHHLDFQRDNVRGLTARIESELRAGDAVLVSAAGFGEVFGYYYRGAAPVYGLPISADARETASDAGRIAGTHGRVFAIFYGSEEQDPERVVERSLNARSYQASQEWVGDMRFARYIAPKNAIEEVHRLDLPVGDIIRFSEYWTSGRTVRPGEFLLVGFSWLATDTPETRYKIFLQLLDAAGRLVAQRDSEPGGGALPTTSWQAGAAYSDRHALLIPADLPAGEYRLIAGLYDINDPMARLPVGESSYVELGVIEVSVAG